MKSIAPPSPRRLDAHYILMQAGFWAMFAAICCYQAALLLERGFSNSQVGLVMAVRCLSGIFFQPLLGSLADRHPEFPLKLIVALSLLLSFFAGLLLIFLPGMGLAGTLAVFAILGALEISSYPLMDSMAIQYINAGIPIRYSLGRGIGSFSYAVFGALLGLQASRWGVESTLVTHSALVAVECIIVALYPTFRPAQPHPSARQASSQAQSHSALTLLRTHPKFALMLAGIFLGLTAYMPLVNFLVNIIVSRGGDSTSLGGALFLMAASELPTAFIFQRLSRRWRSGLLLLVSLIFIALKSICLVFSGSLTAILLIQPLQMLGYGLFTPASVFYVNESVPQEDRILGQTLMMVASNGLGGVAGSFLGGRLLDLGGVDMMLLVCSGMAVGGALLAALSLRTPRPSSLSGS